MANVKSWSFSRLTDYDFDLGGCPAKFKYKHLDKLPEPKGEALERGSTIHKLAEDYIAGTIKRVPKELEKFAVFFKDIKATKKSAPDVVTQEQMLGFTANWEPCRGDDWKNCWLRIKMDCEFKTTNIVHIWDWKTGKFRIEKAVEYMLQLDLYATGTLIRYGDVTVLPSLVYLDTGDVYPPAGEAVTYSSKDLPALKKKWAARVKPMFTDTKFSPRPGNGCRFCTFKAANGGPCKF